MSLFFIDEIYFWEVIALFHFIEDFFVNLKTTDKAPKEEESLNVVIDHNRHIMLKWHRWTYTTQRLTYTHDTQMKIHVRTCDTYLYLYKYENVCLSVCLFVQLFLGHFETDGDTL